MKILFVVNGMFAKGNGLSASARRTVRKLREAGEEVKILSAANPDPNGEQPDFCLKHFKFPVFEKLITRQGYGFAAVDKAIIRQAVKWADVVHIEEPFFIQMATCKIAKEEGVPCTATYHLHPENLFASVGMEKSRLFNDTMMRVWRDKVFDRCKIVQCPTQNVKERLEQWHYKAELRVISNGLVLSDLTRHETGEEVQKPYEAKYVVISIGRYSAEKDLRTLLLSMRYCKHAWDVQLVLAGRGPREKKLRKIAKQLVDEGVLRYPPIFGFHSLTELQAISMTADLYVHCAKIEVEGLSCMEAIQTGLVPIIAKGKYTATSQFALSEDSMYEAGNAEQLAQKIDLWLSDDERRKAEAEKYCNLGNEYDIDKSIEELRLMFRDAVEH